MLGDMSTNLDMAYAAATNEAPEHWKLPGTIVWGLVIAAIFVVVQVITTLVLVLRGKNDLTEQQFQTLLESAESNGVVVSVSTIGTALVCLPLIVGIVKLKRHSNVVDYLALRAVPARSLALWLCALAGFIVLSDGLTVFLGRPVVPEFMTAVYTSAHPVWLIWFALVVAAPAFEETFFRGFLFKGFASSFIGPIGAVAVPAGLWAVVHTQYDLYGIGTVFCMGVLFGLARALSGSLLVPLAMHAASNVVSGIETAFLS
jgi:membrane protease YdiL (CAAX protease family)